jgi:hypothetical protein
MFWRSLLKRDSGRVVVVVGNEAEGDGDRGEATAAKAMVWDLRVPGDARERDGMGE